MKHYKLLLIDLDNTIIYTDFLNNFSYNYALNSLGFSQIYNKGRITRHDIMLAFPSLTASVCKEIIQRKQTFFIENMHLTIPNQALLNHVQSLKNKKKVLWTKSDPVRAQELIRYYNIQNIFDSIIYSEKKVIKYDIEQVCEKYQYNYHQVIVFEDNKHVINELLKLSIKVIEIPPYDVINKITF